MKWAQLHYYTNIYSMTKNKNNKIDLPGIKYINNIKIKS
jgi:hypothetical protein